MNNGECRTPVGHGRRAKSEVRRAKAFPSARERRGTGPVPGFRFPDPCSLLPVPAPSAPCALRPAPLRRSTVLLAALTLLAGCAHVPNQWVEDGPATREPWQSPSARDVLTQQAGPPEVHPRWQQELTLAATDGSVTHWPLYFEDPFVDKGHGRTGLNKYHLGWEDVVASVYGYARHTVNWLLIETSLVVEPPWTLMVSDGELSRQPFGLVNHDAAVAGDIEPPEPR